MSLDVNQLLSDIKSATSSVLDKDVSSFQGFSDRQLQAIAKQAEFVAIGISTGQITEGSRDFFLDGLRDMTDSFVATLSGLAIIMVEKVWNAMVGAIWNALSSATGLVLPVPTQR